MVKFLLLCFLLGNLFLDLAMASDKAQAMVLEPCSSPSSSSNPPAEPPIIRKLGKHSLSPSMAPESEKKLRSNSHDERTSVEVENGGGVLGSHDGQYSHHSIDKSIAGGGVILGGLATTFLVAVFCYIRATGRHNGDPRTSP